MADLSKSTNTHSQSSKGITRRGRRGSGGFNMPVATKCLELSWSTSRFQMAVGSTNDLDHRPQEKTSTRLRAHRILPSAFFYRGKASHQSLKQRNTPRQLISDSHDLNSREDISI